MQKKISEKNGNFQEALTYNDVLLVPQYSEVLPRDVDITSCLTKKIKLNVPIISAAMDTVTESSLAIAIAKEGGIGIIHKNMTAQDQAMHVRKVKNLELGASAHKAIATLDSLGRLRVGAAVGVGPDAISRVKALVQARVDVVVIDTAHGHSWGVIDTLKKIKKEFPKLEVIVGNIATGEAAKALVKAGADAVKVGIGPGSICTTRIIAGVGYPQFSAVLEVAKALRGSGIPTIADGGIRYTGDISKAIAAGASTVMIGSRFAGVEESPGETIMLDGRKYKTYRGMGSIDAMKQGSKDRYFQETENDTKKLVPEGIVGKVAFKGSLGEVMYQLVGGLRAGMGYCGSPDIKTFQKKARFIRITNSGISESHPHDVIITKEAPNYNQGK